MPPSHASDGAAGELEPLHDHLAKTLKEILGCMGKLAARAQGSNARYGYFGKPRPMNQQDLRKRLEPALRRIFHLYWRFARGMTLGVRGVVLDDDNRVFLVKHSYVSGWHLPGGGVEVGETLGDALRRELLEEGRIEVLDEPPLHGVFLNSHVSRRDHVAVYLITHFSQDRLPEPNREIVACGCFDSGALPAETTEGTRLRIAEVLENRAPLSTWR